MVFNKSLFASLLLTSSLGVISSAKAGFDEYGYLKLSVAKLKKGYEEGEITLKDGKRFSVAEFFSWQKADFSMVYDESEEIYGYQNYGEDSYLFQKIGGGGPRYVQNPETGEWYYDYDQLDPGFDVFNLILRPIKEEKEISTNLSERIADLSISSSSTEERVADLSSSSTSSPFSHASSSTPTTEEDSSITIRKTSSAKIFIEPNQISNTAPHSFYAEPIAGRNLWVGIEYMTPESRSWWTQRLGYEAYMHFGKQIAHEYQFLEQMSEEEKAQRMENERIFQESVASISGGSHQGNIDLLPPYVHEAEEFMGQRGATDYDEEFMTVCSENSPENSGQNNDYLSAWRGFQYNLDHHPEIPTWIAYVSSESVEGPLYEKASARSPQIKMAMTLKVGKSFYSPLGIYKSPIATAFDERAGQSHRNLSMMMHAGAARFVGQIQPDVQYMVVRPLASMSSIFAKSGLSFSKSTGIRQDSAALPYIRCTTDLQRRWYSEPEVLSDKEKENYGNSPYIIVDTQTGEYHRIPSDHWFTKSPFLGGMPRENFEDFPFVTASREELGKL